MKFHRVCFPTDHTPRTFDRSLRFCLNPVGFDKGRNLKSAIALFQTSPNPNPLE